VIETSLGPVTVMHPPKMASCSLSRSLQIYLFFCFDLHSTMVSVSFYPLPALKNPLGCIRPPKHIPSQSPSFGDSNNLSSSSYRPIEPPMNLDYSFLSQTKSPFFQLSILLTPLSTYLLPSPSVASPLPLPFHPLVPRFPSLTHFQQS